MRSSSELARFWRAFGDTRFAGKPNALIEVPNGGSFADMVALKGDKEIGDKINKIIGQRRRMTLKA